MSQILWTRVGRRKHKFNRIRQVVPICPHMKAHWCHLANMIELSICGSDAVLCQITLTTSCLLPPVMGKSQIKSCIYISRLLAIENIYEVYM